MHSHCLRGRTSQFSRVTFYLLIEDWLKSFPIKGQAQGDRSYWEKISHCMERRFCRSGCTVTDQFRTRATIVPGALFSAGSR